MASLGGVVSKFLSEYDSKTPQFSVWFIFLIHTPLAHPKTTTKEKWRRWEELYQSFFPSMTRKLRKSWKLWTPTSSTLLTGIIQFVYCCIVGTFPFNSFLSGFISSVASFVLAVCLRIQVNPENKNLFLDISQERAFADFIIAHLLLHLVVVNFIG